MWASIHRLVIVIIIIDNFCIALFSGVPKLTALYNSKLGQGNRGPRRHSFTIRSNSRCTL